jgi:PKD repeat protein
MKFKELLDKRNLAKVIPGLLIAIVLIIIVVRSISPEPSNPCEDVDCTEEPCDDQCCDCDEDSSIAPMDVDFMANGAITDILEIAEGTTVKFESITEPAEAVVSVEWYFESTEDYDALGEKTEYTFNEEGTFSVKMCVNESQNNDCKTIEIIVTGVPVTTQMRGRFSGRENAVLKFTDNSKPADKITSREWYVDGRKVGSSKTLSHKFGSEGSYTVKLCVNGDNCTDEKTVKMYKFVPRVDPKFSISKTQGFVDEKIDFRDLTKANVDIKSRDWDFQNDGNIDAEGELVSWTYKNPGTYTVKFCADGKCTTNVVTVSALPPPPPPPALVNSSLTGLKSDDYCKDGFVGGKSTIKITPKVRTQLTGLTVFANDNGKVAVTINYKDKNGDFHSEKLTSSRGKTVVSEAFSQIFLKKIVLQPGISYDLVIEPKDGIKLNNSKSCGSSSAGDSRLDVRYTGNIVVYDITYNY